MRIAFMHNVQRIAGESEAEFDSPETVAAIVSSLERLNHTVIPLDVDVPVRDLVRSLETFRPDLIFNTAEGRHGRFREALYPAIAEALGIPCTGSDAFTCGVTLDKWLTKQIVAARGVPVAPSALIQKAGDGAAGVTVPMLVKPNFEGSSKGIHLNALVKRPEDLAGRAAAALAEYPDGILVEEYVEGVDVVVPFIEGVSPETGGVLPAVDYDFHGLDPFYHYELKHEDSARVAVRCPAHVPPATQAELLAWSRVVIDALRIRDFGRLDFRVRPDGSVGVLAANALPSLEPGAGIYAAAAAVGLRTMEDALGAVVESAARRHGIAVRPSPKPRPIRVGLTFNLKRAKVTASGEGDHEAEFDSEETVGAIQTALASLGHEVVPIEADARLLDRLQGESLDVVFNVAEGLRGRGRESLVPALMELLDVQYTGSDPASLAVSLDKALAKRVVREAGVATAPFAVLVTGEEPIRADVTFPAVVKPVAEGSSKGIGATSVAKTEEEARAIARQLIARYGQAAMVESFLPGREFTVGILGGQPARALPPMEIVFTAEAGPLPTYHFATKLAYGKEIRYEAPAKVDADLGHALERAALASFEALGCRDVGRVDLRLDARGAVNFIECNPLPGLSPGWSDLCLIAEAAGMTYEGLIAAILEPALHRRMTGGR